jgi:hypothetical protein
MGKYGDQPAQVIRGARTFGGNVALGVPQPHTSRRLWNSASDESWGTARRAWM